MIIPYDHDKFHFAFIIKNHSKRSIKCWCNLNVSILGQPVKLDGFYGGDSSFDIQPLGEMNGHFRIVEILKKANRSIPELAGESNTNNERTLQMNVEFWYGVENSKEIIHNVKQPFYFDFKSNTLVADF